jgi:hypothetical protein
MHENHPIGKRWCDPPRDIDSKSSLANASLTGQRHQAGVGATDQRDNCVELRLPTYEWSEWFWQTLTRRGCMGSHPIVVRFCRWIGSVHGLAPVRNMS